MAARTVSELNFGCWLLKCNPAMWDIDAVMRDRVPVTAWTVADNYRSRMMSDGQPFLLWRTGPSGRGLIGHGKITGRIYEVRGDDPRFTDASYWIEKDFGHKTRYHCPIDLALVRRPVPAEQLRADPTLGGMEVFRQPFMANPLFLDDIEFRAIQKYVALEPE